jgi:Ca-activated chloride channel family protein
MERNKCEIPMYLTAGLLALALSPSLSAQSESVSGRSLPLRADVKMILVPVTVTDPKGATVNGLGRDSFTILDNKAPQKIVSFSAEDVPCSIGLILDLSGSMRNALKPAKEALIEFLGAANPQDEFLLLGITTRPIIYPIGTFQDVEDFTSDTATIQNSIQLAPPGGSTALVDTIYLGLNKMRSARNARRALVVVTDGMDNNSRYSREDLIRRAEEADVQIYTIGLDTIPREMKVQQQVEQRRALNYLEELAVRTGGVHYVIQNRQDASAAAARAGAAIRSQYVIGYQPQDFDSSGQWHKVQVKLDRDHAKVYARSGYYAR